MNKWKKDWRNVGTVHVHDNVNADGERLSSNEPIVHTLDNIWICRATVKW